VLYHRTTPDPVLFEVRRCVRFRLRRKDEEVLEQWPARRRWGRMNARLCVHGGVWGCGLMRALVASNGMAL
jgi:hypothetical protein